MKKLIYFILFLSTLNSFGQNYIEYQKTFNRIDNDIISNDLLTATKRLDTIYFSYDFIFAKHCIKALQICCAKNDSIRADNWLIKSFLHGVPLWIIRNNTLTEKVFDYSKTKETIKLYDSLYAKYKSSINIEISNTIDSLFEIDQEATKKVNNGFVLFRHTIYGMQWLNNNKKQFHIIKNMIDKYGYPGEKLIGLPKYYQDSAIAYNNTVFYGPSLSDIRTYYMLIHYYSNPHKDIYNSLFTNVKKGFMRPEQFGGINDFMAKWGKKKYGDYKYYNVWHTDPNKQNDLEINQRRESIGLSSLEEQNKIDKINFDRRKNKSCNDKIITE